MFSREQALAVRKEALESPLSAEEKAVLETLCSSIQSSAASGLDKCHVKVQKKGNEAVRIGVVGNQLRKLGYLWTANVRSNPEHFLFDVHWSF